MASTLKHLRSSTASKRPTASGLADGQIGINTASGTPGVFFKNSNGEVVKVGPAHVGPAAPNAVPAGSAGNSLGELWVNDGTTIPGLNYYTGSAFVNLTPSGTTAVAGLVELATDAETQTGTDTVRAVTPSGLQSKISDSTSTTSSTTIASATAVKAAYDLANAALPKAGGRITGDLEIGPTGSLSFEGSSDDSFETTLAVVNPTADRTITFPNVTGTVVTTGDSGTITSTMILDGTIVNADIDASAAIALSKLATGALPSGITVSSGNIVDGTITNADVNASAAIAGTKISPNFGSQNVVTTGTATAASLNPTGSSVPTNGVYLPATNSVAISTNGTQKLLIDSSGNIEFPSTGIKAITGRNLAATAANGVLSIFGGDITTNTGANIELYGGSHPSLANLMIFDAGEHRFRAADGSSERARIDSSGRLLVGTSTARTNFDSVGGSRGFLVEGADDVFRLAAIVSSNSSGTNGANLTLAHQKSGAVGGNTILGNGDQIGAVAFQGSDGTNFVPAARIAGEVDGTPGANDMPGRLVFFTTVDGASSPTERMRIANNGNILFAKTTASFGTAGFQISNSGEAGATVSNNACIFANRLASDGILVKFFQDSVEEGTISVSGTTVSYNGAHLSRWSQLPGGAKREEILRGTVLSNIDEMCDWGEEDNEQLNRMKVSDVEGDKNVSGVFQAWDDDDDTYTDDFYCAMTGDFIIRIAEGVTVQRGDLLMSAGDGTAKPQDDDIIRSKTIAKITSTHITCTYEDGSYCVPCVLMAC